MDIDTPAKHFALLRELAHERIFKRQSAYVWNSEPFLCVLSMDVDAAWGTYTQYAVYRNSKHMNRADAAHTVLKKYWDKKQDYYAVFEQHLTPDQPTIIEQVTPVDVIVFAPLWEQGQKITIPVVGIMAMRGNDGADYVVNFGAIFSSASIQLKFWSDVPDEWKPLQTWLRALTNHIDSLVG